MFGRYFLIASAIFGVMHSKSQEDSLQLMPESRKTPNCDVTYMVDTLVFLDRSVYQILSVYHDYASRMGSLDISESVIWYLARDAILKYLEFIDAVRLAISACLHMPNLEDRMNLDVYGIFDKFRKAPFFKFMHPKTANFQAILDLDMHTMMAQNETTEKVIHICTF